DGLMAQHHFLVNQSSDERSPLSIGVRTADSLSLNILFGDLQQRERLCFRNAVCVNKPNELCFRGAPTEITCRTWPQTWAIEDACTSVPSDILTFIRRSIIDENDLHYLSTLDQWRELVETLRESLCAVFTGDNNGHGAWRHGVLSGCH